MTEEAKLPEIQVLSIGTIEELFGSIQPGNYPFTLFLAWDAPEVDRAQLEDWMRPTVEAGLAYFCAWGSRCEAVHDAVDRCDMARLEGALRPDNIVMTTWHQNESLDDAFWFFVHCAELTATRGISEFKRFAAAVGNPRWAEEMRSYLSTLNAT